MSPMSPMSPMGRNTQKIGRAAHAARARASPASITDGEDAVGTSRASARRTSSPIAGVFRRRARREKRGKKSPLASSKARGPEE